MGVATYIDGKLELAVSPGLKGQYEKFTQDVNAYGERAWEKGGRFDGVIRKDEIDPTKNLAQQAAQYVASNDIKNTTGAPSTTVATYDPQVLENAKTTVAVK